MMNIKVLVVFFGVISCALYLGAINASAVKGYEIREIEIQINELSKKNKQLKIQLAENNALHKIKDGLNEIDMIERGEAIYIQENSPIALR